MENAAHAAAMMLYQRHASVVKNGVNRFGTWEQNKIDGAKAREHFQKIHGTVKSWALKNGVIKLSRRTATTTMNGLVGSEVEHESVAASGMLS